MTVLNPIFWCVRKKAILILILILVFLVLQKFYQMENLWTALATRGLLKSEDGKDYPALPTLPLRFISCQFMRMEAQQGMEGMPRYRLAEQEEQEEQEDQKE